MSKAHPIQHSFMGGELSPLMEMRHDIEARKQGVASLINFVIHLQGPASTAPGGEHMAVIEGVYGRLFRFPVATFNSFAIAITTSYVYIVDLSGLVLNNEKLNNFDFLDRDANWNPSSVGNGVVVFDSGRCRLSPGPDETHSVKIHQTATTVVGTDYLCGIRPIEGKGVLRVRIGSSSGNLSDIHDSEYEINSLIKIPFTATSTTSIVTISVEGGDFDRSISRVSVFDVTIPNDSVTFTSPWTSPSDLSSLQGDVPPSVISAYFTCLTVRPHKLTYDKSARTWSFIPVSFTSPPSEWAGTNWPVALAFYEGRLYLGGTPNQPETLWASKSGENNIENFTQGDLADEGMTYTLEQRGAIRWMRGNRNLVIGSENAEYIVTSEGGVIIPGDIHVDKQSANGSAQHQAVEVGNNILYISADGHKIRSMGYEWTKEAWLSQDITFHAGHLADDYPFQYLSYSHNPGNNLMVVKANGEAIMGTYEPVSNTAGFSPRVTPDLVLDMISVPFAGEDVIWVLSINPGETSPSLQLSRVPRGEGFKMSNYTRFEVEYSEEDDPATLQVPHLAEKEVCILVDGAVHASKIADSSGNVTLDYNGREVVIGLNYVSYMRTLPRDDGMSLGGFASGSSRPAKKRWNTIFCRIISSFKPKINGKRPPTRYPTSIPGKVEAPRTENVKIHNLGYDEEGIITIEQDLPVHTTIAGIFGELQQEAP
jgi:hypothetical protein